LLLTLPSIDARAQNDVGPVSSLKELSIEQLLGIEVTSVSKSAEQLSDAAAAVYVITRDDILRSGARTIPDMLRLAPNLQVAQITATSFAITARGFNGSAASKLLVLIDGRSVYTPYHSGVSWDVQDVLPEDIERIEVISGPGATLWGANAVNGVINIITRNSASIQGASVTAGGGNLDQRASLQYGGSASDQASYRAYVDSFHVGPDVTASGTDAMDDWHKSQGGFRFDQAGAQDVLSVHGDFYEGSEDELAPPAKEISGGNLLARWNHELAGGSQLQIQSYYDYVAFSIPAIASDYLNTYDLEAQQSFSWGPRQYIVWGAGEQVQQDNFPTALSSTQGFSPQRRTLNLSDIFLQDSISLTDTLKAVLGAKLEEDTPYMGVEPLPSARLSWKVTNADLLWLAVSRAVRAPSRIDRDLFEAVGPEVIIRGDDFRPEELTAYELGYRGRPSPNTSLSISTFYNVYRDLRSVEPAPDGGFPLTFENRMLGDTCGVEVWGNYQVNTWWRLTGGANWLHENLHFAPGSSGLGGTALAGDDPSYQLSARSTMDLARNLALNFDLRRVGALPNPASPAYTELDSRVGWSVSRSVAVSLTGSNLLHPQHLEFGTASTPIQLGPTGVETGRSVFLEVHWRT
jgi:iron complex outermembrane receptor protein